MKRLVPFILTAILHTSLYAQDPRPNIVFILADDMGYDSVSANNEKMGPLKTPHIDKLISQGMNFTDAHSGSAVCTPTRYGLLTGRYAWRTELKKAVLWDWGRPLIKKETLTVAELLKAQGYATGMVGKWHLGLDWYTPNRSLANGHLKITDASFSKSDAANRVKVAEQTIDYTIPLTGGPNDHGFDYYFGVDVPNFPPYVWIENRLTKGIPTQEKPPSMFGHPGPMLPNWKLENILPTLGKKSAEWITEQSKTDQPFFLYVPLTSPHTPISPSATFQGKSKLGLYSDFILETDATVGLILDTIENTGISDNTIVIFSTDNGTARFAQFKHLKAKGVDLQYHFKGQKGQIHEGGHRVPLAIRWPGKIKPGSTNSEVVCLNDFMATTADILNIDLPDNSAQDSHSILPLLTGEKDLLDSRPLVVNHDFGGRFAIRKGKWKLVIPNKLYNLDADPKETKNIAKDHPGIVKELAATLKQYQESGRSRN